MQNVSQKENFVTEVAVQLDNPGRHDLLKDPVYFSLIFGEAECLWSPICAWDVATIELLTGKDGIKVSKFSVSNAENIRKKYQAEFIFPKEHPFRHEWAKVDFSENGEVLDYEILDRPKPDYLVTYFVEVGYSASGQYEPGIRFPNEFKHRSTTVYRGQPGSDSDNGIWSKLSDFQFDTNSMQQFTLTHFGLPEPSGTTVLHRGLPRWFYGTMIGACLFLFGIYLRKRAGA